MRRQRPLVAVVHFDEQSIPRCLAYLPSVGAVRESDIKVIARRNRTGSYAAGGPFGEMNRDANV